MTLSGNNSYSGGTTVGNGTLVAGGISGQGSISNSNLGNANLSGGGTVAASDFNGKWLERNSLNNDIAVAHRPEPPNGPAPAGSTLPNPYYQHDDVQYSPAEASQFPLAKSDAGTLTLGGNNAYNGTTTFNGGGLQYQYTHPELSPRPDPS